LGSLQEAKIKIRIFRSRSGNKRKVKGKEKGKEVKIHKGGKWASSSKREVHL